MSKLQRHAAAAFTEILQRLASARGVYRDRPQQFTQVLRARGVKAAVCATG